MKYILIGLAILLVVLSGVNLWFYFCVSRLTLSLFAGIFAAAVAVFAFFVSSWLD